MEFKGRVAFANVGDGFVRLGVLQEKGAVVVPEKGTVPYEEDETGLEAEADKLAE